MAEDCEKRDDIADYFYARFWARKILFGGRPNAFDRVDTVRRLQTVLDRVEKVSEQRDLSAWMWQEAPFAPYDLLSILGKPRPLLEWVVVRRIIPIRVPNALGRISVAVLYNTLNMLWDALEQDRRQAVT